MDENHDSSSQRLGGTEGYNRLSTLEIEDQHNAGTREDFGLMSEIHQYCYDLQQVFDSSCHGIDWDRIFFTAFITISIFLLVIAFFPYMSTQLILDQRFEHEFGLSSLVISEFQASPSEVTGKCDVMLNITNSGERSIYHENSVLSIFLDHELLWVTRTGDFFLEVGNNIMFNVSINRTAVSVPASYVPTALLESQKLHKPLNFKLKYDGILREGLATWYEERSHIYVICGWVEMQFINETTIQGGPANCSIETS